MSLAWGSGLFCGLKKKNGAWFWSTSRLTEERTLFVSHPTVLNRQRPPGWGVNLDEKVNQALYPLLCWSPQEDQNSPSYISTQPSFLSPSWNPLTRPSGTHCQWPAKSPFSPWLLNSSFFFLPCLSGSHTYWTQHSIFIISILKRPFHYPEMKCIDNRICLPT